MKERRFNKTKFFKTLMKLKPNVDLKERKMTRNVTAQKPIFAKHKLSMWNMSLHLFLNLAAERFALPASGWAWIRLGSRKNSTPEKCS
jgi:hypothetical protein